MSNVRPLIRTGGPESEAHSTGLAIAHRPAEGEDGDHDFSFRVEPSGRVLELGGWGFAGPLPGFGTMINVPPNPRTIHTVAVEDDGAATRKGVRKIIDKHLEKYGECQVYVGVGVGHDIINWARIGCPAELDEAPTDDELRDMETTEILGRDDRQFDESHPNPELGEHDAGTVPGALEVEKEMVAQARQAAGANHPAVQATSAPARAAEAKRRARERAQGQVQPSTGPQEPQGPPAEAEATSPPAGEAEG